MLVAYGKDKWLTLMDKMEWGLRKWLTAMTGGLPPRQVAYRNDRDGVGAIQVACCHYKWLTTVTKME